MPVENRLLCPTTNQVCSYRTHLEELYTPYDSISLPPGYNATTDSIKLTARLLEHGTAAVILNCAGLSNDGTCPTAEYMANNIPRNAAKKVVSFFRGKK